MNKKITKILTLMSFVITLCLLMLYILGIIICIIEQVSLIPILVFSVLLIIMNIILYYYFISCKFVFDRNVTYKMIKFIKIINPILIGINMVFLFSIGSSVLFLIIMQMIGEWFFGMFLLICMIYLLFLSTDILLAKKIKLLQKGEN